jgi:hypothetical protein
MRIWYYLNQAASSAPAIAIADSAGKQVALLHQTRPDLIYQLPDLDNLELVRLGSHSELGRG